MIGRIFFVVIGYFAVIAFMLASGNFSLDLAIFFGLATALFCLAIIMKKRREVENGNHAFIGDEFLSGRNKEK